MIIYFTHIVFLLLIVYFILKKTVSKSDYTLFILLFGSKIIAGWTIGYLYFYYYEHGDTIEYYKEAQKVVKAIFPSIRDYFEYAFLNDYKKVGYGERVYPSAFAFYKLISPLYFLCGGKYVLMSMYCSIFSAIGFYKLLITIKKFFPELSNAFTISCFFPSVLLWSSGLLRESIVMGSMGLVFSWVLELSHRNKVSWWYHISIPILLYWILIFKYYFFVPFITVSLLILLNSIQIKNIYKIAGFMGLFIALISFVQATHLNFNLSKLFSLITDNHDGNIEFCYYSVKGENINESNVIKFQHLDNTWQHFFLNIPKSIYAGLFLPQINSINRIVKLFTGIENSLLFFLFLISISKIILKNEYYILTKKEFIWVFVFIFPMAIILPLTSPNLGTLARYKIAYLPILSMILMYYSGFSNWLSNWFNLMIKKGQQK